MKKKLTMIVAALLVCLMAFAMTACGGGKSDGGNAGGGSKGGEVVDVGDFTVTVPKGWAKFNSTDPFGEKDANGNYPVKTDQCYLVKGGTSDLDVLLKPCVTVTYYTDQTVDQQKEALSWFVDEVNEKEYSANGTACSAFETKTESILEEGQFDTAFYIFLPAEKGLFSFNFSGDELTLDDADIKAVVESVSLK